MYGLAAVRLKFGLRLDLCQSLTHSGKNDRFWFCDVVGSLISSQVYDRWRIFKGKSKTTQKNKLIFGVFRGIIIRSFVTMVINGSQNRLYGPGGGTRRLYQMLCYGGEIGSTYCNKSVSFTRHGTVVIGLNKYNCQINKSGKTSPSGC